MFYPIYFHFFTIFLFVISFYFCVFGATNEYTYYVFLLFVVKCVDFQEQVRVVIRKTRKGKECG